MAVEITGWGCPSFRESVSSQYSLTRPDLWRSSWSWPYQYSRVPHYYCERLPFPRSPLSWSARIEMINVRQAESVLIRMVRCGHGVSNRGQWKLGQRCWNRWSMDDLDQRGGELMISCGGGRGCWTKLTKYLGHLINSTECATRTADKDTAVLHSRRLNDSTLRGRWDLFSTKNVDFWDFDDNDIRDL